MDKKQEFDCKIDVMKKVKYDSEAGPMFADIITAICKNKDSSCEYYFSLCDIGNNESSISIQCSYKKKRICMGFCNDETKSLRNFINGDEKYLYLHDSNHHWYFEKRDEELYICDICVDVCDEPIDFDLVVELDLIEYDIYDLTHSDIRKIIIPNSIMRVLKDVINMRIKE